MKAKNSTVDPGETQEIAQLLLLADAFTGLNHAFNNHLNTIVLQAAALQMRVPPEFKEALDRIRKEGAQAANLFRPLSWHRQQVRQSFRPIDLGEALKSSLADSPKDQWIVTAEKGATIPATPAVLKRMFGYLLPGLLDLKSETESGQITLTASPVVLHLDLAPRDADAREQFQKLAEGHENDLSLPFLAARSLLRLLEGRMEMAEPDPSTIRLSLLW